MYVGSTDSAACSTACGDLRQRRGQALAGTAPDRVTLHADDSAEVGTTAGIPVDVERKTKVTAWNW